MNYSDGNFTKSLFITSCQFFHVHTEKAYWGDGRLEQMLPVVKIND